MEGVVIECASTVKSCETVSASLLEGAAAADRSGQVRSADLEGGSVEAFVFVLLFHETRLGKE